MRYRPCLSFIAVLIFQTAVSAGDWTQFQGPNRNGISPERGLARSWPEGGPKEIWSCPVGVGWGGAVVQNGKVFFLDREDDERDVMRCLDFDSGKELWRYENNVPGRLQYNGSRAVPCIDDKSIYAIGLFGQVYCVNTKTHQATWIVDIMKQFDKEPPDHGFAESPMLLGDHLIISPATTKIGMVALDKKTGKVVWQSDPVSDGGKSFSVPILTKIDGVEGILFVSNSQVSFIDPANGKMLLKYTDYTCERQIPFPTPLGDGRFFLSGGYKAGSRMVKISQKAGTFQLKELYRLRYGSQVHPILLWDGFLYGNFNNNENIRPKKPDGLMCFDLDGNVRWKTGNAPDIERGNLIIADGLILFLEGQTGYLVLAEANPNEYKELARTKIFKGGRKSNIWAPIALSNGRIIIRDQNIMKCLDVKNP
ncbi:MAG: PQQ-binding-like beta-propeller repeat protein [Planctomycetes bacterium]|nr:PQQ-binding-like beta-propeller repeat protein [Planctomycetota bacterium]